MKIRENSPHMQAGQWETVRANINWTSLMQDGLFVCLSTEVLKLGTSFSDIMLVYLFFMDVGQLSQFFILTTYM